MFPWTQRVTGPGLPSRKHSPASSVRGGEPGSTEALTAARLCLPLPSPSPQHGLSCRARSRHPERCGHSRVAAFTAESETGLHRRHPAIPSPGPSCCGEIGPSCHGVSHRDPPAPGHGARELAPSGNLPSNFRSFAGWLLDLWQLDVGHGGTVHRGLGRCSQSGSFLQRAVSGISRSPLPAQLRDLQGSRHKEDPGPSERPGSSIRAISQTWALAGPGLCTGPAAGHQPHRCALCAPKPRGRLSLRAREMAPRKKSVPHWAPLLSGSPDSTLSGPVSRRHTAEDLLKRRGLHL